MKKVWKCDFCQHTGVIVKDMILHEENCGLNPKLKNCYSCEHHYDFWESTRCRLELNVFDGEDEGNCIGWKTNNESLMRKLKLEQLYKLNKL